MKEDIAPDWNEIWKTQLALNRSTPGFREGTSLWSDREQARRYAARSKRDHASRVAWILQNLDISPGDRVLDIGSGPGTLALPLARAGARVAAIDPAEGMLIELREAARREKIETITTICSLWEDIDPDGDLAPPYDRVIASFSLTVPEIRPALAAMDAVAAESGQIHIYWFADEPPWEQRYIALWEDLHGAPYHPRPKADCLFNVLYSMGIYADVQMHPMEETTYFATVEEAIDHFSPRMGVETPEQREILREYLCKHITPQNDRLTLSGRSTYAAIWWRKSDIRRGTRGQLPVRRG